MVCTAGHDRLAVGTEGDGQDIVVMLEGPAQSLARGRLPEERGVLPTSQQGFAVRAECDGRDDPLMLQGRAEAFAGRRLPHLRQEVLAPRRHCPAIGTEGYAEHVGAMLEQ